jgi:hypothetical protein
MTTSANPALTLTDGQLSAIYVSSDEVANRGQKRTKFSVKTELAGLIVAGLAGITSVRVGAEQFDILAAISALAFGVALVSTAVRASKKPEGDWYAGRAAAESVRTMAWRFAVGGAPFPPATPDTDAPTLFLSRLEQILRALPDTDMGTTSLGAREITTEMKDVRAAAVETRKEVYRRDRIEDQLAWYQKRAGTHRKSARRWLTVTIGASALGFVAASLKFFNVIDFDMLGVFGSIASAAIAWNQLNQHRTIVSAYTVTARELSIIRDRIDGTPEADWPQFVSDSEDAISREHTMWLARHGHTTTSN